MTTSVMPILKSDDSQWNSLLDKAKDTAFGKSVMEQEELRSVGLGLPHTDNKFRLFLDNDNPVPIDLLKREKSNIRVKFYRDTAG